MGTGRLMVLSVTRWRSDGSQETLEFSEGVNLLIGEGNTGKTKWLQTIDYLMGDEVKAEERDDPESVLFQLYDAASAVIRVNGEEFHVERRWKEPRTLGKVYLNGEPIGVRDYCRQLMSKLGMPEVHYPQGNPYGARTWPELTWRTLFRHIYRREDKWTDLADSQPEIDQHASLIMFLGSAERIFSSDYGDLVTKNKRLWELQAKRDQFMSMLDQISKELVDAAELGVALTPESLEAAQTKRAAELTSIEEKREQLLLQVRAGAESKLALPEREGAAIEQVFKQLVELQAEQEKLDGAMKGALSRIQELMTTQKLLEEEADKLARAREAGAVLADLRVTHCPACDQSLEKTHDESHCYVCGQSVPLQQNSSGSRRIEFEIEQVASELEETKQLLGELKEDLEAKQLRYRSIEEAITYRKAVLRPIRQAAAAVLPPELFVLDVNYGRVQEKRHQLHRIRAVLDKREQLAADIVSIQQQIAVSEAAVDIKGSSVDFETLGDHIRDGMNTYLNRIKELNPNSWLGSPVSAKIGERNIRLRVGESGWKTKLGGTQRLYFLFAYQYALLNLSRYEETLYPGFLMLDFPASLEDRAAIADKENFILEPFVELLQQKEMAGCQMIAAGRAFKELKNVSAHEFVEVYK